MDFKFTMSNSILFRSPSVHATLLEMLSNDIIVYEMSCFIIPFY